MFLLILRMTTQNILKIKTITLQIECIKVEKLPKNHYVCRKAAKGSWVDWFDSDWPSSKVIARSITRKGNLSQNSDQTITEQQKAA